MTVILPPWLGGGSVNPATMPGGTAPVWPSSFPSAPQQKPYVWPVNDPAFNPYAAGGTASAPSYGGGRTQATTIPMGPLAGQYKGTAATYGGTTPASTVPAALQNIIRSDPFYSQQIALLNAQEAAAAAQRTQGVQQALIQFGGVPDMQSFYGSGQMGPPPPKPVYGGPAQPNPANFAGGRLDKAYRAAYQNYVQAYKRYQDELKKWEALYGVGGTTLGPYAQDVTELIRQAALQNTQAGLSVEARLQHQSELQRQSIINDLAARGILDSGETGYQLGQQALSSKQAEYDAAQELQQYLQGVYAAFAQAQLQGEFGRQAALQDAYGRQSAAIQAGTSSIPTRNVQQQPPRRGSQE